VRNVVRLREVLYRLADHFGNTLLGWIGWFIAEQIWVKKYERLTLDQIVENFIPSEAEREELRRLLREDDRLKRSVLFVEFLKRFNLEMARASILMSTLHREWGNITGRLINAISWSYGFGWLSWLGLSPVLNTLIARPSEEAMNEAFPQRVLTYSQVIRLLREGKITEREARERLHKLGYSDEEINLLITFAQAEETKREKDLSKADILKAYVEGLIDHDDAVRELTKLGYSVDEALLLLRLAESRKELATKTKERDLTKAPILKAFRIGMITREEAKSMLVNIGYSEDEAEFLIRVEEADMQASKHEQERDLTKAEILTLFEYGLIDEYTAKEKLKALGYDDEEAEALIALRLIKMYERSKSKSASGET